MSCVDRELFKNFTREEIREKILRKLGMVNPPNVTTDSVPVSLAHLRRFDWQGWFSPIHLRGHQGLAASQAQIDYRIVQQPPKSVYLLRALSLISLLGHVKNIPTRAGPLSPNDLNTASNHLFLVSPSSTLSASSSPATTTSSTEATAEAAAEVTEVTEAAARTG